MTDDNGKPLPLTSHTLAPVPVAIGGGGLPDNVIFRTDLPKAGLANITGAHFAAQTTCLDSPSSVTLPSAVETPSSSAASLLLLYPAWLTRLEQLGSTQLG